MTATTTPTPSRPRRKPAATPAAPGSETAAAVQVIPLASIDPDPHNIRGPVGDVDGLAESIRNQGLQSPLVVAAPTGRSKRYQLIAGHRRHAACAKAGLTEALCIVRHGLDPVARLEAQIVENLQREDLDPIAEARGFQRLLDTDTNLRGQRALAGRLGVAQSHVSKRLALLALDPDDQALVATGKWSIAEGIELAKLAAHRAAYKRARVHAGDGDAETVRQAVREELDEVEWAEKRKAARAQLDAAKATVVAWPKSGWYQITAKPLHENEPIAGQQLGHGYGQSIPRHLLLAKDITTATCGHVVHMIAPNGQIVVCCANPKAHEPKPARKDTSKLTAGERKARDEAAAKRAAKKATDAALNIAFEHNPGAPAAATIDRILDQADDPGTALLELLARQALRRGSPGNTAKRLGIEPLPGQWGKDWHGGIQAWIDLDPTTAGRRRRLLHVASAHLAMELAADLHNGLSDGAFGPGARDALARFIATHTHEAP